MKDKDGLYENKEVVQSVLLIRYKKIMSGNMNAKLGKEIWLRCCARNRKVAGSIPDGVIGIFH